jgi:hypothetical protein
VNKIQELYHNDEHGEQHEIDGQAQVKKITSLSPKTLSLVGKYVQTIKKGDRVQIINKICNPLGKRLDIKDKVGTVTGVDVITNRVYLCTNNGTDTWRLPKNIEVITPK